MDDCNRTAVVIQRVLDGGAHETPGAVAGDRLDADAAVFGKADFADAHFVVQEGDHAAAFLGIRRPLDAGVYVLRVLAEDHHVGQIGTFHRGWDPREPSHGAQTDVEIQLLSQGHVEAADAAAHGGRQGAFHGHQTLAQGFDGFSRQPLVFAVGRDGLFVGEYFHPGHPAAAAVGLGHGRVPDRHRRTGDIRAGAVPLDIGNDRHVGDVEALGGTGDCPAFFRNSYM